MMQRMRSIPLVLLCCLAATSCATAAKQTWAKPGATPEDLGRDRYACMQESRVPWGQGYGGFSYGSSGGGGGWGSGASMAQGGDDGGFIFLGVHRRAQSQANRLFDACMQSRGWQ